MSYFIDDNPQYKQVIGAIPDNITSAYNNPKDWYEKAFEASSLLHKAVRSNLSPDKKCELIESEIATLLGYVIEIKKESVKG